MKEDVNIGSLDVALVFINIILGKISTMLSGIVWLVYLMSISLVLLTSKLNGNETIEWILVFAPVSVPLIIILGFGLICSLNDYFVGNRDKEK